jgi:hypothetical protein
MSELPAFDIEGLEKAVVGFGISVSEFAEAVSLAAEIDRAKTQLAMLVSYEDVGRISEWAMNRVGVSASSYVEHLRLAYSMLLSGEDLETILNS